MTQKPTTAYRIAAAESAIWEHNRSLDRNGDESICSTEDDANELLRSLALWAEVNGICLRIPKPDHTETEVST